MAFGYNRPLKCGLRQFQAFLPGVHMVESTRLPVVYLVSATIGDSRIDTYTLKTFCGYGRPYDVFGGCGLACLSGLLSDLVCKQLAPRINSVSESIVFKQFSVKFGRSQFGRVSVRGPVSRPCFWSKSLIVDMKRSKQRIMSNCARSPKFLNLSRDGWVFHSILQVFKGNAKTLVLRGERNRRLFL